MTVEFCDLTPTSNDIGYLYIDVNYVPSFLVCAWQSLEKDMFKHIKMCYYYYVIQNALRMTDFAI